MSTPAIYSPARIEILLHIYCSAEPLRDAQVTTDTIEEFLELGVIEDDSTRACRYSLTPLGEAWVHALCATKLPVPAFADEAGNIIKRP